MFESIGWLKIQPMHDGVTGNRLAAMIAGVQQPNTTIPGLDLRRVVPSNIPAVRKQDVLGWPGVGAFFRRLNVNRGDPPIGIVLGDPVRPRSRVHETSG